MSANPRPGDECCQHSEDPDLCPEGHPLTTNGRLDEARRMADCDPICQPEDYDAIRTENLLTSCAYSLLAIADVVARSEVS